MGRSRCCDWTACLTICRIGSDFEAKVKGEFDKMIERHLTREMA
jgi:hypothetical protein